MFSLLKICEFITPGQPLKALMHKLSALERIHGKGLTFRTTGIAQPEEVTLRPLFDIPYEHYTVYRDVLSANDSQARQAAMQVEKKRRQAEEARIVDEFNPGEQQSEVDHKFNAGLSKTGDFRDRKWRTADSGGFFEFQMKVLCDTPQLLRCTYWGDDTGNREFDILVDGKLLATQKLDHNQPGKFFDIDYPLPAAGLSGKDAVPVRIQPHAGNSTGGLFGCTVLKNHPTPQ